MSEYYGFENLECWKQAKDLAADMCRLSVRDAMDGDRVVGDLLCRSAIAVMSRIAEGKERRGSFEFVESLQQARGSTAALRSGLILSRDMGYLPEGDFIDLQDRANRVAALIGGLIKAIRKSRQNRGGESGSSPQSGDAAGQAAPE